ncbi:Zinc finger PHD-type [Arabidopsis suecica]|uniref:E3 ubiquitin-protein ligase ORTHRUS n=1 Tax=Arabidopsis suecica TaxID=45249 RepID=A0A8T2HGT2_ARASU|nr:Zinc finger PHD-type [Arabidopsis suecica]
MAIQTQLPCDGDGVCMRCQVTPPSEETLTCGTCVTPWHVSCLLPESLASSTGDWECPDCSGVVVPSAAPGTGISGPESSGSVLVAAIRAIQADVTLTEAEKAKKRQRLMSGGGDDGVDDEEKKKLEIFCSICIQLPERPVTTPCGHNFCLKCFEKWAVGQGKLTCMICRSKIPRHVAKNPRINLALVSAIRLANVTKCSGEATAAKVHHIIRNQDRPDKAFTTERAVKTGKANAASGKFFVTIPRDHFGPIPAANDVTRNQGVLVGESWEDRQECRQWGVHFPHVAGIAGQAAVGAQSVALSGGYDDDEDHGEWFLYTGSGGRDLSGNKRVNKIQSSDQAFKNMNEALRLSCKMGYPVRVVRSWKEKRSAYAPAEGVRYDGVYRIEKCWSNVGVQGLHKMCRYLFVRCDNEPAPWTSDEHGDRPRPLPDVPELENATDLFVRKESPSWGFDEAEGRWKWMKSPPVSRMALDTEERKKNKRAKKGNNTMKARLLKEFSCQICRKVLSLPVTTPCAHNFCKACIEAKFAGITQLRDRSNGVRKLRAKKNIMTCPCCTTDLSEFLQNPQVNREMMEIIENFKKSEEEAEVAESSNISEEEGEEESEPPTKKIKMDKNSVGGTSLSA